jgi:hypothetical protein
MIEPKTHPIEGVFLLSLYNSHILTKGAFSISILFCSLNKRFRGHEPSENHDRNENCEQSVSMITPVPAQCGDHPMSPSSITDPREATVPRENRMTYDWRYSNNKPWFLGTTACGGGSTG